jgi:amidase
MHDYADLDATAIAERVRRREVHPREVLETAIAAIEKVNPQLNAVVHRMYDRARAAPVTEGPFAGVPFVVKDLDGAVAGEPYTMSCRALAGYVPERDAEVIARLRRAGLVLLAKTNTPEFGIVAITEPELRGPTRNPWDPERSPGGSSGGTAALVAARAVPMGHGGDGGGSIRIPASACGLFGLKPTRGRNPLGPDAGEGWGGYVQPHVLTRSVRDSAAALDATHGPDAGDPYCAPLVTRPFVEELRHPPGKLRIAFSVGSLYGRSVHPECVAAVQDAAKLCASLGHHVEEATPRFNRDEMVRAYFVQVAAGVASAIVEAARLTGRPVGRGSFERPTWLLGQIGRRMSALDLQLSRDACQRLGRQMAEFHQRHDVFLTATLADLPPRVGELALKGPDKLALGVLRAVPAKFLLEKALSDLGGKHLERTPNTMLFNQTGQPAMSVPLSVSTTGLPIGVQLAARFGEEATLFRLAAQLEQARPWIARKPSICAEGTPAK